MVTAHTSQSRTDSLNPLVRFALLGKRSTAELTDRQKMIAFIDRHLEDGCGRLVLAQGATCRDDIIADVMVIGDEIVVESNCPEWVSICEIYEHLRWESMPTWEQRKWLKSAVRPSNDAVAQLDAFGDRLADTLFSRLRPDTHVGTTRNQESQLAPYRFQMVGTIWHIHFPVNGEVRVTHIPDSVLLRQMHYCLQNQDRVVSSATLAGHDDLETLGLIAADKNQFKKPRHGDLTIEALQKALKAEQDRLEAARENGVAEAITAAENALANFQEWAGKDEKDFKRLVNQKEEVSNLGKSFHASVRKNKRRLLAALKNDKHKMKECAAFLEMTVRPEGYGFAYRPPSPAPDWVL